MFISQAGLAFAQSKAPSLDDARISPTLYFPSAAAELSSRAPLQALVAEKIKQLPNASVAQLAHGLDGADELFIALQRHLAYIKVQALENIDDQALRAGGDQIAAAQAQLDTAMAQRLRLVPPAEITSLGRYAYLAQQLQGEVPTVTHRMLRGIAMR
ncbi:hypothetical protein [Granulicella rosea]|nr:hypothetical protein [Granulicella rosea]